MLSRFRLAGLAPASYLVSRRRIVKPIRYAYYIRGYARNPRSYASYAGYASKMPTGIRAQEQAYPRP